LSIRYLNLENGQTYTQRFTGGYAASLNFKNTGDCKTWTCRASHVSRNYVKCPWNSANIILLEVNFTPRHGSAYRGQWSRNRFTMQGSYYYIEGNKM